MTDAASQICPRCGGTGLIHVFDAKALVAAIAVAVGDRAFNARELVEHAPEVGGPLAAAVGNLSARKLGKALRRIAGKDFAGLRIEKIGDDRDGAIWRIASLDQTRVGAS